MTRHNKPADQPLTRSKTGAGSDQDAGHHPIDARTARPRRVLVVEDHPAALALLAMWLGDHGFRVQEFDNIRQAMQSIDGRPPRSVH